MWCDLRKPITWYKISNLSYLYHMMKVWIILFSDLFTWAFCDTGIKRTYWCSKVVKKKEKHQNYVVNFLYFAITLCNIRQVFADHITYGHWHYNTKIYFCFPCFVWLLVSLFLNLFILLYNNLEYNVLYMLKSILQDENQSERDDRYQEVLK